MIAICLAYSSWERIVLVALGVAFFYWHNEEQRNRYLVNLIRRIQAVQLPAPARAADGQQVLAGPDQTTNATTDTNAATEETSPPPPPEAPPVLHPLDRLASTVRLITVTSFRFIYAVFTSLVPEFIWRRTSLSPPVFLSQPFGIRSGVRQGYILSPILFNYAIDWFLGRALRESDGVEFAPGHRLTDLDYADDSALLASSFGDLQSMVSRVNEVTKSVGLSINAGRLKCSSCIPDQEKAPLGIDGCQLEEVDSLKYLGVRLLPNGQ
nr:unnamed protein product [Spirometra erinaceieuropaei]